MKELTQIIDTEFNKKGKEFFGNHFIYKIYRGNEGDHVPIHRTQVNELIDTLNFFWEEHFDKDEVYSINDDFLIIATLELKIPGSIGVESFSAMTLDEYGINVFRKIKIQEHQHIANESNRFNYQLWTEIDHIDLVEIDRTKYLRFYLTDSTSYGDVELDLFGAGGTEAAQFLMEMFTRIAKFVQSTRQMKEDEVDQIFLKVNDLIEKGGNYNLALEVLEKHNREKSHEDYQLSKFHLYYWYKVGCFLNTDRPNEALSVIDYYLSNFKENEFTPEFLTCKAGILLGRGEYFNSLEYLDQSEELCENVAQKRTVRLHKDEVLNEIGNNFIQIPKSERKMILMSNQVYRSPSGSFIALDMSNLSNLNFPIGHPKLNEVYIAHPYRNDYYLPLNNSAEELTLDRISEFETLLQSLGATYLEISSNNSDLNEEKSSRKEKGNIDVGYKIHGLKVGAERKQTRKSLLDLDSKISHTQKFKPYKKPFIPDDLVWYHSDLNWQKLAKQRLVGNLIEHKELISLSHVENFSRQELIKLDVELKAFMAKIGVKYSKDIETESRSSKKLTWTVSVRFEDTRNLVETHESSTKEKTIGMDEKVNPLKQITKTLLLWWKMMVSLVGRKKIPR